jgi:hypothetical protein
MTFVPIEMPLIGRSGFDMRRRLARQGDISAARIGRQWRVKRDLLGRCVKERSMSKPDEPGERS